MSRKDYSLLREILDSAHNGILLVDETGEVVVFNRAAGRVTEHDPREVLGRNYGEFEPEVWEDMRQVLVTGEPQVGRRTTSRSGTMIFGNRTPVYLDGEIVGVISVFQDATEYERVLSELHAYRQLSEQLDVIIDSSYDGLWISDAEGKVVRVNPASERFAGVNAKEVIGCNVSELVEAGYFDRSVTLEVLKQQAAVSLIQQSKDGRQVLVTGNPVLDENGEISLVVINARDLTAMKRLQEELEQSRALTDQYRSELTHIHRQDELSSRLVMRSKVMRRIFDMAMKVARVDSCVLLQGESGAGKSVLAKLIHRASSRSEGPLVRVDCGGIPSSLIEAELFGYVGGAFTGALSEGKTGYFELADGGTLFLDEVGELPLLMQAKLLRFLEDNEVVPVGATAPRKIDVRVLAASNRDLEKMVRAGAFRKDLYFRLNVVPIHLPPLRERVEDIPHLIAHFLDIFNQKCGKQMKLSSAAVDRLRRYAFPGNVRELANLIEQLVVLSPGDTITPDDLPAEIRQTPFELSPEGEGEAWDLAAAVARTEREVIARALAEYGSQRSAAEALGVNHSTLSRKAKRYGLFGAKTQHVAK
ncbi:sigma 54-interacting transcriptional regulator [Desulfoferula mesophila]|uniref:HTH-type transcriptional regulatory protein TyrR n=1 Tax=Desulfoferula mesophila TaxID=3058419 RepID=A0AAU9EB39_9BACT|nr:sigma-54 dependent transcriptional regulator [Desulfoferula mesophilus]